MLEKNIEITENSVEISLNHRTLIQPNEISQLDAVFHRGPRKRSGLTLTGWILLSAVVDHLVIIFKSIVFILLASVIFKLINNKEILIFFNELFNLHNRVTTFSAIYFLISMVYFISFRVLMSATIGEWSCGLRIGQPSERRQINYVFKILFRVLLITVSGIVTLPVLSLIFKKDLAGQLTKASIYTLK